MATRAYASSGTNQYTGAERKFTRSYKGAVSEDPLIQNCLTNKKHFKTNHQKFFKCTSKFSKLICGFQ